MKLLQKANPFFTSPSQMLALLCQSASTNVSQSTVSPAPWFLFTETAFVLLNNFIWSDRS